MTFARHGPRCFSGLEQTLCQMSRRKHSMPRRSSESTSSPIHNPNTHTPHHHAPCTLITSTFLTLLPGSNLAQLTPSRRNRRSAKRTLTSTARRTRDSWPRRRRRRQAEGGRGGQATEETQRHQEAPPAPQRRMVRLGAAGWLPAPVARAALLATPAGHRADPPPTEGA
jgi:hypothetical protein